MTEDLDVSARELTSGMRLARNSMLNLASQVLPFILIIIVLPFLITQLGSDRFGILTFLWTILAYFGVSDFGIGYVTTRLVAAQLGTEDRSDVAEIFWTCTSLLLLVGVVLMLAFFFLIPWLSKSGLSVPEQYKAETTRCLFILGFCLPFSVVATACRGLLEAYQRFALRNVIVLVNAAFMYLGLLVTVMFSKRLDIIASVLLVSRVIVFVLYGVFCLVTVPALRRKIELRPVIVRQVLSLGSWTTLSAIASPLLQYGDRILISSLVSITAVGFYFIPAELATKLLIVVGSITSVMIPLFATTIEQDTARAVRFFELGLKIVLLFNFILTFAISMAAGQILSIWLGESIAQRSTIVLQILSISVLFSAVGIVAHSFVLGAGRPDIAAKLHVVELVIYLPVAAVLISNLGIEGAALAGTARIACDAMLLLWQAHCLMRRAQCDLTKPIVFLVVGAFALAGLLIPLSVHMKIVYVLIVLPAYCLAAWRFMFAPDDRDVVLWVLNSAMTGKIFQRGHISRPHPGSLDS